MVLVLSCSCTSLFMLDTFAIKTPATITSLLGTLKQAQTGGRPVDDDLPEWETIKDVTAFASMDVEALCTLLLSCHLVLVCDGEGQWAAGEWTEFAISAVCLRTGRTIVICDFFVRTAV